jgi:hypothetical protein
MEGQLRYILARIRRHDMAYEDKYNEEELDSPETIEAVESMITSQIDNNLTPNMNRAQRRALVKKMGKRGRAQTNTISETAKKLNYIELIQRLREMNEKNEEVNDNEN